MSAFFRRMSKSTVGTVLMVLFLGAIVASFALADVQSYLNGGLGQPGTLVKVGKAAVSERELSSALQRRLADVRQQKPEADYSSLSGDFEQILSSLVESRAILAFAAGNNLRISKRMVDAEIVKLPATRGLDGKFSQAAYQAFLQQQQLTDEQVRDLVRSSLASRLLIAPAAANARLPVGVATPYASMLLEAREAEVALVPTAAFAGGIAEPSEADVRAFYKQNSARYMVPEQRVLTIARMGPEQVASVSASDEEIAAFYKANQALYGGKSTRVVAQAILQDEAQARALTQRAKSGGNLGAGARNLGARTREDLAGIAGEAVATAVFSANQGAIVGPIRSDLGWHVIKIEAVQNEAGRPLSAVKGEIAEKLSADKRKEALTALVTKVEDSIADGASFAEAAKAAGLSTLRTPAITAGGVARSRPDFKVPEQLAPAVATGFELGDGDEPMVETLKGEAGYALVGVDEVIAAAPAPLDSIRDQVVANWKTKQARDRARAVASGIAAKVAGGAAMAEAARQSGASLPPPEKVARRRLELSQFGGNVPPAMGMMFSLAQGRSRMVADPNGNGFIIVKVTRIVPGNAALQPTLVSRTQTEFQQAASAEYAQQMTNAIKAEVGVKRNEAAITEARKRITGGGN